MSVQVKPALPGVAFFAAALCLPLLTPNGAHAADTCLTAPNRQAPQGSHWYYRIERPSLRKCWRLVAKDAKDAKDQKDQRAAARPAQPGPEETQETPAETSAPASAAKGPAVRQAEPETPPPAPVVRTLVTRNVSNTNEAATPLPPPEPSLPGADAPARMPQGAVTAQPPATPDQPVPQPVVTSANTDASSPDGVWTWGHLFGAIAILGFLTSAILLLMHFVRRRMDVMSTVRDEDEAPHETPASAPAAEPTFAPLPPMALAAREDDVDQALRRFARNVRRRAA